MICLAARTDNNSCFDSSNRLHESPERRYVIFSEILLFNTNYAFDGWIIRAPAFFLFFFTKNKKAGPARKMMWFFIFFISAVKKLLLRPDAIPSSWVFIRHALFYNDKDNYWYSHWKLEYAAHYAKFIPRVYFFHKKSRTISTVFLRNSTQKSKTKTCPCIKNS